MEFFRTDEAVAIDDVIRTMREICALVDAMRPEMSGDLEAELSALHDELDREEAALIKVLARQDDRAGQPSDEKVLLEVAALKLRRGLADDPDQPVRDAISSLKSRLTEEAGIALNFVKDPAAKLVLEQIAI